MKKNLGTGERWLRAVGGASLITGSLVAPLPWAVRLAAFGAMGAYLLFTALAGSCLGYRLMGKSTCALEPHP